MPVWRRAAATMAGCAVAAIALTGCQKPLPQLTVLSGSTTITVGPQTYCFDATHCHFPKDGLTGVHAHPGSTLLVDVPRSVASGPWDVVSAVQVSNGKFRTIKGANYQSGTVRNAHTTRVDVPYGVGTYYLVVTQHSASATGSWIAEITIAK